jgi:hypothetical protein
MFYSFVTLVAIWSFQEYWDQIGIPLIYFGYLWFAINAAIAVTGRYAHKVEKALGSESVLILIGALPIIGFFGIGSTASLYGLIFCFLFQWVRGLVSVVIPDALNKRVSGDMRATANSVMSLGTRILMIGVGPLVGATIDHSGMAVAMQGLGYLYFAVFLILLVPLLALRKQFDPITKKA